MVGDAGLGVPPQDEIAARSTRLEYDNRAAHGDRSKHPLAGIKIGTAETVLQFYRSDKVGVHARRRAWVSITRSSRERGGNPSVWPG